MHHLNWHSLRFFDIPSPIPQGAKRLISHTFQERALKKNSPFLFFLQLYLVLKEPSLGFLRVNGYTRVSGHTRLVGEINPFVAGGGLRVTQRMFRKPPHFEQVLNCRHSCISFPWRLTIRNSRFHICQGSHVISGIGAQYTSPLVDCLVSRFLSITGLDIPHTLKHFCVYKTII